jgi:hypothetical protein
LSGPSGAAAVIPRPPGGLHSDAQHVTDPLGRVGAAIGDGEGDYMIIDPATAMVLDQTTYPVHQGRYPRHRRRHRSL